MKTITLLCLFIAFVIANEQKEKEARANPPIVGLAWNNGNAANMYTLVGNGWSKVGWVYNWNSIPDANAISGANLEFVPMMWGVRQVDITNYNNAMSQGVFSHTSSVLAFNEPDNSGQSNLSPSAAAGYYQQYIRPLNLRKGAPAVTSAPSGKVWLQNFINACNGNCPIDFIPIHWYGSNATEFANYVQDMYNTFKIPIWVTEWACVNYDGLNTCQDQNYVYGFMGQSTYFLYYSGYVERFAWFGSLMNMNGVPDTDRLITADGTAATNLGVQYASKGGCCPCYTGCSNELLAMSIKGF